MLYSVELAGLIWLRNDVGVDGFEPPTLCL